MGVRGVSCTSYAGYVLALADNLPFIDLNGVRLQVGVSREDLPLVLDDHRVSKARPTPTIGVEVMNGEPNRPGCYSKYTPTPITFAVQIEIDGIALGCRLMAATIAIGIEAT
jgi:hypothetical protein